MTTATKEKEHLHIARFEFNVDAPRLKRARKKAAELRVEADKVLSDTESTQTVMCPKCEKRSQVKKIVYADWYWYESPHGCTDGDMWHRGGFFMMCPKCEHVTKVYPATKYESDEKQKYYAAIKHLIRTYVIQDEDKKLTDWYNWYDK